MKQTGQKGFSLVEVLITIGIIAIVAAIAIPQLQRYATNSRLKSAARDVMGDIFLCKQRAVAENRQYRMTFSIANNNYTIEQPPGTVIQTKTPTTFGNDIRISNVGTTETVYTFQTRGTVNAGTVVLINDRGSTATITTNITGRTSVRFNLQ